MSKIIIYVDEGVGGVALKHVVKALSHEVDLTRHTLVRMDAKALIKESWEKETTLLVVPGGRDVYYQSALHPEGTWKIRNFVANGGSYLGLCAGAYFACNFIEFEKGGHLEVCGKRHLEFFPGKAIGPAYGLNKYCYETEKGAEAALISFKGEECFTYFNGGCFFEGVERFSHVDVWATYEHIAGKPAAIVYCPFEKGRAILSGVHIEYSSKSLSPGNAQIESIYPALQETEEKRRTLFREMLKALSVNLSS